MTVVEKVARAMFVHATGGTDERWETRAIKDDWNAQAWAALTALHDSFADPVVRAAIQAALDEKDG